MLLVTVSRILCFSTLALISCFLSFSFNKEEGGNRNGNSIFVFAFLNTASPFSVSKSPSLDCAFNRHRRRFFSNYSITPKKYNRAFLSLPQQISFVSNEEIKIPGETTMNINANTNANINTDDDGSGGYNTKNINETNESEDKNENEKANIPTFNRYKADKRYANMLVQLSSGIYPTNPKGKICITSVSELHKVLYEDGLRLRDIDVRGNICKYNEETHISVNKDDEGKDVNKNREEEGNDINYNIEMVHPVMKILRDRIESESQPQARQDKYKVALALEGGGMRGVVGAGMLAALSYLGYEDCFDVVYGSSAGSLMGAYFISGQTPYEGPGIYYDELSYGANRFIDMGNIWRVVGLGFVDLKNWFVNLRTRLGKPVLNLDYLLNDVVFDLKPLDFDKFWERQQKVPLKVVASGLLSKKAVVLSSESGNFKDLEELTNCMRASMLLPGIAGPLVRIPEHNTGGDVEMTYWPEFEKDSGILEWRKNQKTFVKASEPMCDALLFEPIPYRSAVNEGATHVLVLRTRPDDVSVTGKLTFFEKMTYRRFFTRKHELPGMAKWMENQNHKKIYAEDILLLNEKAKERVPVDKTTNNKKDKTLSKPVIDNNNNNNNHDNDDDDDDKYKTSYQADHVKLMPIACSSPMPEVKRLELKREVLLEGCRHGFTAAFDALVVDPAMKGKGSEVARKIFHDNLQVAPYLKQLQDSPSLTAQEIAAKYTNKK